MIVSDSPLKRIEILASGIFHCGLTERVEWLRQVCLLFDQKREQMAREREKNGRGDGERQKIDDCRGMVIGRRKGVTNQRTRRAIC